MKYCKEDNDLYPIKDWCAHSPVLHQLKWTVRTLGALISSKTTLYGFKDTTTGYNTTRRALMEAIEQRNNKGLGMPVDLDFAYANLSPVPLPEDVLQNK